MKSKFIKHFFLIILITLSYSLSFGQIQEQTTLLGKVKILGFQHNIAIFMNDYDDEMTNDEMIDRVFILQSDNDYFTVDLNIDEVCEINLFPGMMFIKSSENTLLFGLKNIIDNVAKEFFDTNMLIFEGYGLAQTNVQDFFLEKSNITNESEEDPLAFILSFSPTKAGPGGSGGVAVDCGNCASGGPGSSSCSKSGTFNGVSCSCSVSCGSGYYACCQTCEKCQCCKNSSGSNSKSIADPKAIIYPNPAISEFIVEFQLIDNEFVHFLMVQELNTGEIVFKRENITDKLLVIETTNFKKGYYVISYLVDDSVNSSILLIQ